MKNSSSNQFRKLLVAVSVVAMLTLDGIPSTSFDRAKYRISYGNSIQNAVQWRRALAQTPCPPHLLVLAFVTSSPAHLERRDRIRNTWANPIYYPRRDLKVLFVLGAINNESLQAALDNETAHYNDIIQNNFYDSYRNLSYKTIAWLSWAVAHCTDVPYVLKVDDDVVVNPFNLQRFYHEINKQAAPNTKKEHTTVGKIYGRVIYALPQRKGRWALTKEEYPEETFPPYTTGAAYIIDRESVTQLWNHVPFVSVLWIEDVFLTGLVARAAELRHVGINHLYLENFTSISLYEGETIFLFEASPSDIQSSWDRIINKTKH